MLEALSTPFMQRAIVAGVLVALLASYYGVFVVQRGMSFMGDGLAHAAFGGVALALLLGSEHYLFVALPFTVAVAVGIHFVQQRTRISGDTAIGIFFATSMALGIIFLALKKTYTADAFSILFGDILAIQTGDLILASAAVVASLGTLPLWGRWAYATFDRELAQADRLRVERDDYILAVFLAITVVVAVKIVGVVLIAALLVIPPATARLIAPTFIKMTFVSMLLGFVSIVIGMIGAWHFDVPPGPAIILVQSTMFFFTALSTRR
ncbi:metal ABC transporter permease [bacterium]|nr:metal ABC transporter permease [bacterium]